MMMKTRMFIAKSFAKKHYKGAMDAMKSLSGKAKNEAALVKLAGVKNYSKLRMNRMKKSSTFKKTKEYAGVAVGSTIVGAGIGSLATQGYNKIKNKKKG
mgnify:FL=1